MIDSISLEFLLALLLFMSLFWYKTWIFTQYISGLTCQQWMLPWIQWGILFPWTFFQPCYTLCLCLVQDLDLYSVYQWSYLSTVDVTLDTVIDSISLEYLLALTSSKDKYLGFLWALIVLPWLQIYSCFVMSGTL